jgi:RPA family protein
MDFAQLEAEFASHVVAIANAKPAAKAARQANKAVIELLPAYKAAYVGNVVFSLYAAEKHDVHQDTINRWLAAPAKAIARKEAQRIAAALKRAKAKLSADKQNRQKNAKSQPIRLELVNQATVLYASMTQEERFAFAAEAITPNPNKDQ